MIVQLLFFQHLKSFRALSNLEEEGVHSKRQKKKVIHTGEKAKAHYKEIQTRKEKKRKA